MARKSTWYITFVSAGVLLLGLAAKSVLADGTETLGPPGIAIASGSDITAAGTGMLAQPGTIDIAVPPGATVNQVLLYWEGQMSTNVAGDDTIEVNGTSVTGTLIGGPAFFFDGAYSSAFRADITGLGLVGAGLNSLTVDGLTFSKVANGAGILVIFDDGSGSAEIDIRDGLDNAFINFPEPRKSTVPQTITFSPAGIDRVADFDLFFSSVAGTVSGADADRPTSIEVTVDGTTTIFSNELASLDGEEWDTVTLGFDIPAGASTLTVQAFSRDDNNTGNLPASFTWTAAGLSLLPADPGIDIEKLTNGNQADGADDPDVPQILPGDTVTWTYQVTNTGDVAFSEAEVMVADDQGAVPVLDPGSDDGGDMVLSPGEMWLYTASAQALNLQFPLAVGTVPGCGDGRPTYENMGTVTVESFNLSDEDPSHYCNPGEPQIDIRKQAEGADSRTFVSGSDVPFVIVVTNTGTVDLVNVVVTDVLAPQCDNNIGFLAAGDSVSYLCTAPDVSESFTNEACVSGEDGVTVRDCDPSTVEIIDIDIRKQAEGPDTRTFPSGSDVPFEIVVTNTGPEDLSNVEVTDPLVPDCARFIGDLAAGASVTYSCTAPSVTAGFTNVAKVTGERNGVMVMDDDPSTVEIPPAGGQGCTPGYWKQPHHFDSWVGFDPGDDFEAVFGVDASFDKTLLGALEQGGGGEKALGRHAVAALLNTSNADVSYAFTTAGVIAIVQEAYATGDFEGVKNQLAAENERGCPLN